MDWADGKPLAKALFGRPARVLLAAWILGRQGAPFYLLEAQRALTQHGEAHSAVARELDVLVTSGLLDRIEDAHRVYFQPMPHGLWSAFESIARHFELSDVLERDPNSRATTSRPS